MTRSAKIRGGLARRARLLLALADGATYDAIGVQLRASPTLTSRWKRRFQETGPV